jgi:hypothetical protein
LEDKEQLEDYLILHNKAKLEKQNINKANFWAVTKMDMPMIPKEWKTV